MLSFRVKKEMMVRLETDGKWSPFEMVYLILSLYIRDIEEYRTKQKLRLIEII